MAFISPYHQVFGPEFNYSMPNLELATNAYSYKQKRFEQNYKAFSDLKNTAFDIPLLHDKAKDKLKGYEQQINDLVNSNSNFSDPSVIKNLTNNVRTVLNDEDIRVDYQKYMDYSGKKQEIEESRKKGNYNPYSDGLIDLELNDYLKSDITSQKGKKFSAYIPHVDMDKDIIDPCVKSVKEVVYDVETIGMSGDKPHPLNTRTSTKGRNYDELNGCIKNSLLNNTQARAYLESIEKYKYLSNPDPNKRIDVLKNHDANMYDNITYYSSIKAQYENERAQYLKAGQMSKVADLDQQIARTNKALVQLQDSTYGTYENGIWSPTDKVNTLLQSQTADDELLNLSYNTTYDLYSKNYSSALDGKDQVVQYKKNLLYEAEQEAKQQHLDNAFRQQEFGLEQQKFNLDVQEANRKAQSANGLDENGLPLQNPLGPGVPSSDNSTQLSIVDLRDSANNELTAMRPEAEAIYKKPESQRTMAEKKIIAEYENLNKIRDGYQKRYDEMWNSSLAKALETDLNRFSVANRKESLDFGRSNEFRALMEAFGDGKNFNLNDPIFKGSTGETVGGIKVDVEEFKKKYFSDADFKAKVDKLYWERSSTTYYTGGAYGVGSGEKTTTQEAPLSSTLNKSVQQVVEANKVTTTPFTKTTVIAMNEGNEAAKTQKANFVNAKLFELNSKNPELGLTSDMFSQVTWNPYTGKMTGTLKLELSGNAKAKLKSLEVEGKSIANIENNKITLDLLPEKSFDAHFYQLAHSNSLDASNPFKTISGIEYYATPSPVNKMKEAGMVNFYYRLPGELDFRIYAPEVNGRLLPTEISSSMSVSEIEDTLEKIYATTTTVPTTK